MCFYGVFIKRIAFFECFFFEKGSVKHPERVATRCSSFIKKGPSLVHLLITKCKPVNVSKMGIMFSFLRSKILFGVVCPLVNGSLQDEFPLKIREKIL